MFSKLCFLQGYDLGPMLIRQIQYFFQFDFHGRGRKAIHIVLNNIKRFAMWIGYGDVDRIWRL